jgi:hypothetical protein
LALVEAMASSENTPPFAEISQMEKKAGTLAFSVAVIEVAPEGAERL